LGFFAGIGRIRTDLSGDPSFAQVLDRTRESVLGLFEHQDLPFMRIRDVVAPDFAHGAADGHPLARLPVEFQYFHAGQDGWAPGLGVVERAGPDKGPDELFFRGQLHPLSITLLDDGTQLWGEINYKVDFYHAVSIERLAVALERLLPAAAAAPDRRLSELAAAWRLDDDALAAGAAAHIAVGSWLLES
jgi:non-ribosomal peptide synthetase component F